LTFFLVKLSLPLRFRVFTVLADVAPFVAARAVAAFDIIIQLALCLRGNLIAIDDRVEVGPFETGRELAGLFVVRAACEVGIGRVFGLVALLPILALLLGFGASFLVMFLRLVTLFLARFVVRLIEDFGDGRLDPTVVRWVGTIVDGSLDPFQGVSVTSPRILC
jgi:hypothetical protein